VTGWRAYAGEPGDGLDSGLYNAQALSTLLVPRQRYSAFVSSEVSPRRGLRLFAQGQFGHRATLQTLAPATLGGFSVAASNAYNPFGRDFLDGDLWRRVVEAGPQVHTQTVNAAGLVGGAEGSIPGVVGSEEWRWSLSGSYALARTALHTDGNLDASRVAAALGPSFIANDGSPRCGSPAAPIDGCVPLDVFDGAGSMTPAMIDWIRYKGFGRERSERLGGRRRRRRGLRAARRTVR